MSPASTTNTLMTSLLLAVCFFAGCSESKDPVGSISGQITLKGDGYSDCKASIYCETSFVSRASQVEPTGTFEIKDVPPGDYIVMVYPKPVETPDEGRDPPDRSPIPKKFRTRKTSELTVSVEADKVSEIEIELAK